ncbi:uncharacterized protein LOC141917303 [Strix aluco]|uniref:uncharacterized protein LOC141917303 n=1 Tax=Strix aluco TaxID=111821 RepID=UPI003DA3C513
MAESHPEPAGTGLRGLVPPSHFVLRPPGPSTRPLEAELEAEKRRGQALEVELDAEKRRGQALEAELGVEKGRGQALEAELEAERRRGQALEAELEAERRRGQALEVELEAEKRRGQALEAELEAERRRGQALEAELEAGKRRGQAQGTEPDGGQPLEECQAQVLLQARLSALGHILTLQEHELGRELPPPGVPVAMAPPRLQALLGRWREKVFTLLVQLRVQEEVQRVLRAQVGTLGAAVTAGTRRVKRLELSLREGAATAELQRRDREVRGDTGDGGDTRGMWRGRTGTCWGNGDPLGTYGDMMGKWGPAGDVEGHSGEMGMWRDRVGTYGVTLGKRGPPGDMRGQAPGGGHGATDQSRGGDVGDLSPVPTPGPARRRPYDVGCHPPRSVSPHIPLRTQRPVLATWDWGRECPPLPSCTQTSRDSGFWDTLLGRAGVAEGHRGGALGTPGLQSSDSQAGSQGGTEGVTGGPRG